MKIGMTMKHGMTKIMIYFILFIICSNSFSQEIEAIEDGESMRNVRIKLNQVIIKGNDVHNIVNYGAIGDNNTDNTIVIQTAFDAAKLDGGIVYIPYGIFKTGTIESDYRVSIIGQGRYSVLKSINAEPLITTIMDSYFENDEWVHPHGYYENFTLDGNNIGTVGVLAERMAFFYWDRVNVEQFTEKGVYLYGSLIGSFNDCVFEKSPCNIYADSAATPMSETNHVAFKNCNFKYGSNYSIEWYNGRSVKFENCDFEYNGTDGDSLTGVIKYVNNITGSDNGDFMGLNFEGCWFERNYGYMIYLMESNTVSQLHICSNTNFTYNDLYPEGTVFKIVGVTKKNHLKIYNSNLSDYRLLIAEGANAYVSIINSNPRQIRNRGATVLETISNYGYLHPPAGNIPVDILNAAGWATIYVEGVEYRIKLYQ